MAPEIAWTAHALERLVERGLTRDVVERAVRELHAVRQSNDGLADWRIDAGRFVVLYDHPSRDCVDTIQIITAWPKRRKRRRHLQSLDDDTKGYPDR